MTQISPFRYFGLMGRPSVDVNDQSCNVIPSESSVADLEVIVQLIRGSTICKRAQVSIIIWKHVLRIFQKVHFEFRMVLPCTLHGCTIHKKPGASFSTFLEHWLNGLTWKREQGRVQKASVERQNKKSHECPSCIFICCFTSELWSLVCCDFVYWPFLNDTSQQLGYSPW